jgi:hypothetical protein
MTDKFSRDPQSGGIVSRDEKSYSMARKAREARRKRSETALTQQKKANTLEQTLINFELRLSAIEKELKDLKG